MKKVIVTGALGYLGSKLIDYLVENDSETEILAIDNLSSGNPNVLTSDPKFENVRFVHGNILALDLPLYFEQAEAVFHLAAITNPSASFEETDLVYRVNTEGTLRVGEACAQTGSYLVFSSTTSVYAKPEGMILEEEADQCLGPQTPYADSKFKAEQALHELTDLNYGVLRLGTVFGVSKEMHFRTAVHKFCLEAVRSGQVTVWESALEQLRPYCDIEDVVRSMIFLAERRQTEKMMHAATEHATVRQLLAQLKNILPDFKICTVKHQAMNSFSYEVDCSGLKNRGFEFRGSLRRGIEEVIRDLQEQTPVFSTDSPIK